MNLQAPALGGKRGLQNLMGGNRGEMADLPAGLRRPDGIKTRWGASDNLFDTVMVAGAGEAIDAQLPQAFHAGGGIAHGDAVEREIKAENTVFGDRCHEFRTGPEHVAAHHAGIALLGKKLPKDKRGVGMEHQPKATVQVGKGVFQLKTVLCLGGKAETEKIKALRAVKGDGHDLSGLSLDLGVGGEDEAIFFGVQKFIVIPVPSQTKCAEILALRSGWISHRQQFAQLR